MVCAAPGRAGQRRDSDVKEPHVHALRPMHARAAAHDGVRERARPDGKVATGNDLCGHPEGRARLSVK
ncbi:hypothetical protein GCM10023193_37130 [Planotetraspora kaengkrachanensis]|uniref:Uncharacterized protein n=1 Tax=Planotetraspora kaengkrachanensis TaxID=575193 RepID=A0A8J3LVU0_9ACTN|nr:hypothetical protein Pka01_24390 [Planotetraspora kaengkrachanensis]